MMASAPGRPNRGKQFETRFREDFKKSFPNCLIMRLPDNVSGYYKTARNPCDFVCFVHGTLHLVEVKCHYGNTFPFSALRQYEILKGLSVYEGVRCEVVIWFIDKDRVLLVPIEAIGKEMAKGRKSISASNPPEGSLDVPSKKLRSFMESDYSEVMS